MATTADSVKEVYATSGLMELNLRSATWTDGGSFYATIDSRDGAGRILESSETTDAGTTPRGYSYDADGRVTEERQDCVRIASYLYDAQGNRTELHRYDAAGTETESRTASYDARDRLLDDGVASYTYDAAGRRATKTITSTGDVTRYSYDELGHLTRVELPTGTVVEYTYDALGRRTGRTTDGAVDGSTDTAWVYGAGPAPLAQLDGRGNLELLYVYGTRSWLPDIIIAPDAAGVRAEMVVIADHRGSVRNLVERSSGLNIGAIDYDAFGRFTGVPSTLTRSYYGFAFAGGILDADSGLLHLGARDYDPETGTWIESDPIRFGGGDTNLYAYVGGDPVNAVDPSGNLVFYVSGGAEIGLANGLSASVGVYFGNRRDGTFDAGFFVTVSYKPLVIGAVASGTMALGLLFGNVEDFEGDSVSNTLEAFPGAGGKLTWGNSCHALGSEQGPPFIELGAGAGWGADISAVQIAHTWTISTFEILDHLEQWRRGG